MPQSIAARLLLDAGVAALILATYGYSVRKWRERSLDRRRALVEEREPHRVEHLDAAIAGLQAHVHAGKMTRRPEILAAARQAIAQAGLASLYEARVEPGGAQGWRVDLGPRTPPGSLDAWLRAHAAVALVSVPVVLVHAVYALGSLQPEGSGRGLPSPDRSPLTAVLLLVYLATAATGVIASAIRWLGAGAREIDLLRERMQGLEAAIADALPGTPRAEAHAAQRERLALAHPVAVSRLRLLETCLVLHVPLATASLGLAVTHMLVTLYY